MTITRGVFSLIALTACLTAASCTMYKPKAYIPKNDFQKQYLTDVASSTLLADYNAMPQDSPERIQAKTMRRNQILQKLIALIDANYSVFEEKYYGSDARVNFAGDVVNLGLTGVSSVTGTAHLKAVLSAIATGTTGIKTSYEKDFFDQQTRAAVVQRMRAGRATKLALIEDQNHMKAPILCPPAGCPPVKGVAVSPYTLETGLSDVAAYYDEGTVIGALQAIAAAAGQDQTNAQQSQKKNSKAVQIF